MKTQRITNLFFYCCLLLFLNGCSSYLSRRSTAFDQIKLLRENALLVRVKTADKKIEALQKTNRKKEAQQTVDEIEAQNEAIFKSFQNNFNFSKVYFFDGNDAKYLRKQKYDQITLYDMEKKPLSDNTFLSNGYLIAAVDNIHELVFVDTTRY